MHVIFQGGAVTPGSSNIWFTDIERKTKINA